MLSEESKNKIIDIIEEEIKMTPKYRYLIQGSFTITEEEWQDVENWQKEHTIKAHNGSTYAGAAGGRWTYEFTPTGIGDAKCVRCSCGASHTFGELG